MVAQSYAIWPHMSVFENIVFPLRMSKFDKNLLANRVARYGSVKRSGTRNATDLSGASNNV